jgi:hypothetical protein
MANQEQIMERWCEVQEGKNKHNFSDTGSNVKHYNGPRLYSYGTHFELARRLSNGMYLLNGDGSSSSTSKQQAKLRNVMAGGNFWWWDEKERRSRWGDHAPREHVIIPHSAMESAGIDIDTIEVVDMRDAEPLETVFERPMLPVFVRETKKEAEEYGPQSWQGMWIESWMRRQRAEETEFGWRWVEEIHRLGECIFFADVTWRDQRRRAMFISAWDNQDVRTYFLSELPYPVVSLAEAYEALKPNTVKLGELEGKRIVRQGDIFGVETSFTSGQVADILKPEGMLPGARHSIKEHVERMAYLLGTNHCATESVTLPNGAVLARGNLWHKPEGRRPDHRRQVLGKKWYVIVRNTVPVIAEQGAA